MNARYGLHAGVLKRGKTDVAVQATPSAHI
jgi:hypothetical protein